MSIESFDLVKFGIMHFSDPAGGEGDFSGLTIGSKKDIKELNSFLEWCDEKKIKFLFGWRMVKMATDFGYYYRLCPSLSFLEEKDAVYIRLVWPDLEIHIEHTGEE